MCGLLPIESDDNQPEQAKVSAGDNIREQFTLTPPYVRASQESALMYLSRMREHLEQGQSNSAGNV